MKTSDRIIVYGVGFLIGMLLVSMLLSRRTQREEAAVDPWVAHNAEMVAAGAEPLPSAMPAAIHQGQIIDFGYLPNAEQPEQRVWLLNFEESYPYVRAVESVASGEFSFMAADQICIYLAQGVDVTELKPMLDELGLRLRMFNRKESIAVIGVLNTQIDAVPATIAAVQPWSDLFVSAQADVLRFKGKPTE
ncbi:hypothetical protein SH580_06830 [Coraliomargarita algicola]|uniref:Uncharacterized protein n=1 Tax=Coraliomargarita algicola TaxID=3092156 RepID=A0ABZ0RQJ9_9BACT|nr:hypothetical protein [Coraliomargarita sp. J2-16]WPJ97423.1 hypothetical protein SH580_06830 [Coraliomargarita sp. J2-16]